jgi:DNA polymerase-3 subunit epsilon
MRMADGGLNQSLDKTTFAVVDVETTGLSPWTGDRVCEIGCLRGRGGQVLGQLEALVDPGRRISPGAYRVNRITAEMLAGAPSFGDVAPRLLALLEGAALVAHNAPFDLGFLAAEFARAGLSLPALPVIDTLALARQVYRFRSNSLGAVAVALGVATPPTHRALADVRTTWGVLQRMMAGLAEGSRVATLGELLAVQGGSVPLPSSSKMAVPADTPLPPAISEALEHGGSVRMRYVDGRGRETERTVRPLRVRATRGRLYLVAHCFRRGATRTFRLDRVVELAPEEG